MSCTWGTLAKDPAMLLDDILSSRAPEAPVGLGSWGDGSGVLGVCARAHSPPRPYSWGER